MFLCRQSLIQAHNRGDIEVKSDEDILYGPSSITIHAGDDWFRLDMPYDIVLDEPDKLPKLERILAKETGHFILPAKEMALVYSKEKIGLNLQHFGMISGTSDLARIGLSVEFSWFVSPGFGFKSPSALVLELFNSGSRSIFVPKGMRLAHLVLGQLDQITDLAYKDQDVTYDSNIDLSPASKIGKRHAKRLDNRK
jgi:deoxycytidine triphosphate deaminase